MLEVAPEDLQFDPLAGGRFQVAGTDRSIRLLELAKSEPLNGEGSITGISPTFPNGCHICEIEIDPSTGQLKITRYVVVDDFGKLLNPRIVAGQIHGGIAQGLGQVLCEEASYDPESDQPGAVTFMDYAFRRADLFPSIEFETREYPALSNELGVKGCGESGSVGSRPALHLGVLNALAPHGIKYLAPPFSPLRIWQALQA